MGAGDDTGQFERLRTLFDRIAQLDPVLREAVIHSACGDDAAMERELRALLDAHDREHGRTGETRVRLLEDGAQALASGAETGERVGPFVLREVLGRGGMGVVYRAERADGEVRQQVAVKVLQRMHLDEAGVRRFAQERDIVAQLSHPGIARLFDAGSTRDGFPYYAMELVDGEPITAWCASRKLPVAERLELFLKVCDAVRFAHANLVLHRDIKPANVLVDANGTPKLIDFGIAKPITATDDTATGLQLFSPSNAAPEQLRGERCGVACDVYQLGTLLYEMLAGTTVLGDATRTPADIEAAILHRVPTRPSEIARDQSTAKQLRGDLDTIVLRALRKEPERRYASVEQLADEVRRHLRDEPIAARGGDRVYRLATFVQRRRGTIAATGAVVLLVAAFVATLLAQAQRLQLERDAARTERDRAQAITRFLAGVFADADPVRSKGRNMPVGQILDRSRRRLESELKDQPDVRAPLLAVLAEVYLALDDAPTADALIDEAERQLRGAAPLDDRSLVEFLIRVSIVRVGNNEFDAAEEAARRAIALHERLGDGAGRQWPARELLIRVQGRRQDYSSAKQPLLDALRAVEADPTADPLVVANVRAVVGHSMTFLEEYALAERLLRASLAERERLLPSDHPDVVNTRFALGYLLGRTGRAREGVPLMQAAIDIREQLHGANSSQVARATARLAEMHLATGDLASALASAQRAVDIQRTLATSRPGESMVLEQIIGEVHRQRGSLDEAERHYREALRIQDEVSGPGGTNAIEFRTALASILAQQGKHDEAAGVLARVAANVDFSSPVHARWGVEYAEALHRLGRDDEAGEVLRRTDTILAAHAETLRPEADRAAMLRGELGPD